jgi:hypothetical protein
VVDAEFVHFDSTRSAKRSLEPLDVAAGAQRDGGASREQIDAALRGEARMSARVRRAVEQLDSALAVRPTPTTLVVTLTCSRASLPDPLVPGVRVTEPAYLDASLVADLTLPPGAEVVVKLEVPPGVPALYLESSIPGEASTLLLARGLEWEVLRVIHASAPLVVTARVVPRGDRGEGA